jgi:hypothetical protein
VSWQEKEGRRGLGGEGSWRNKETKGRVGRSGGQVVVVVVVVVKEGR